MMGTPYLLLVESNEDDILLTLRALRRDGFPLPVTTVYDGVEALAFLEGTAELPAAVLLDCRLPRLDSGELIAILRANGRTRDLPVLLLAGSSDEQAWLNRLGSRWRADGCLVKPLGPQALRNSMGELGVLPRDGSSRMVA